LIFGLHSPRLDRRPVDSGFCDTALFRPAQLSGQGVSVTCQDITFVTRPHAASRRPWEVRMQAVAPSVILRPSFQQKQSGSGACAGLGGSSGDGRLGRPDGRPTEERKDAQQQRWRDLSQRWGRPRLFASCLEKTRDSGCHKSLPCDERSWVSADYAV
jgi:hypothetical protein